MLSNLNSKITDSPLKYINADTSFNLNNIQIRSQDLALAKNIESNATVETVEDAPLFHELVKESDSLTNLIIESKD